MTAIEKLLQIAFAEEGYLEKRSCAYLDDKIANAGSNNYTKYWRDMKPTFQEQPWCDCWVSWVFMKTFGVDIAQKLLCGGLYSYYTPASAQCFASQGRLDKNPCVGDQVFFTKNGYGSGSYHTGIVYAVNAQTVYTIEGNTSGGSGVIDNGGGVAKKSYPRSYYANKMIFGHPNYSIVVTEASKVIQEQTQSKKQIIKPKYQVGKSYKLMKDMTVYTGAGVNHMTYKHNELTESLKAKDINKDGKLGKGAKVKCYAIQKLDNGNIWIKISKVEYWLLAYKKDNKQVNLIDL